MNKIPINTKAVGPAAMAMYTAQHKENVIQHKQADLLMQLQLSHNSVATYHLERLCYLLIAQTPKELKDKNLHFCYGANEVRRNARLILQDLKEYQAFIEKQLHNVRVGKDSELQGLSPHERYLRFSERVANTLEDSDEVLGKIIADLDRFLESRVPKYGDIHPADPIICTQMLKCMVLVSTSFAIWHRFTVACPLLRTSEMKIMDLYKPYLRLEKIFKRIRILNEKAKVIPYNFEKVFYSPEIHGKPDPKTGAWSGGITPRYRDAICSARFADRIILIRDGYDPHLRDEIVSLFDGMSGSCDVPKDMPDCQ